MSETGWPRLMIAVDLIGDWAPEAVVDMGEGYRREGSTKETEVSGKEGVFERVERGDDGDDGVESRKEPRGEDRGLDGSSMVLEIEGRPCIKTKKERKGQRVMGRRARPS